MIFKCKFIWTLVKHNFFVSQIIEIKYKYKGFHLVFKEYIFKSKSKYESLIKKNLPCSSTDEEIKHKFSLFCAWIRNFFNQTFILLFNLRVKNILAFIIYNYIYTYSNDNNSISLEYNQKMLCQRSIKLLCCYIIQLNSPIKNEHCCSRWIDIEIFKF